MFGLGFGLKPLYVVTSHKLVDLIISASMAKSPQHPRPPLGIKQQLDYIIDLNIALFELLSPTHMVRSQFIIIWTIKILYGFLKIFTLKILTLLSRQINGIRKIVYIEKHIL